MPGCFFLTDASLAFQSQCSLWQEDEIILAINYKLYYFVWGVYQNISLCELKSMARALGLAYMMNSENARLNLTLSIRLYLVREVKSPSAQ